MESVKAQNSRRGFLKNLLAGTAATVALPALGKGFTEDKPDSLPSLPQPGDEGYWEMVKKQFIVPSNLVMVNAANLCPSPYFVMEQVEATLRELNQNVSFQFRDKYDDIRQKSLTALAGYLGATKEEIGITRNTSESNNIIVNGFDFKAGDEVILWDQNHESNQIAWEQRAKRFGFTIRKVSVPANPASPEALIDPFVKAMTPKTRMISFSHISNHTGVALPAKELCQIARQKKIISHLDGAQSFGFLDINLKEIGCDSYSGSAHKWLMGPLENGVIYITRENIARMWPNTITAGWEDNQQTVDRKFCVLGQRNETTPVAIPTIIDFHLTIGKKNVEARVRQLNTYLKDKIRNRFPQAQFVSPVPTSMSGGIVVVNFPGKPVQEIYQKLYTDHGIAGAPMDGVRISPNIYNTLGDMDRVFDALVKVVG